LLATSVFDVTGGVEGLVCYPNNIKHNKLRLEDEVFSFSLYEKMENPPTFSQFVHYVPYLKKEGRRGLKRSEGKNIPISFGSDNKSMTVISNGKVFIFERFKPTPDIDSKDLKTKRLPYLTVQIDGGRKYPCGIGQQPDDADIPQDPNGNG
jgi:hypothetical protein